MRLILASFSLLIVTRLKILATRVKLLATRLKLLAELFKALLWELDWHVMMFGFFAPPTTFEQRVQRIDSVRQALMHGQRRLQRGH